MSARELPSVSPRSALLLGVIAGCVTFGLYAAWIALRFGFDVPPSSTGDEISYDSIAWELSHSNGFSVDYADPEFRKPYDEAGLVAPELYRVPDAASGAVAYRPPLFPVIVSFADRLVGRQFYLTRIFNVFCIAATAGMIAWFVFREFGILPMTTVLLLFWADTRTRLYARAILTEPLACILCSAMTLIMLRLFRRADGRLRWVAALAIVTGLSILARSIVVAWVPGLTIMLWWMSWGARKVSIQAVVCICGLFLFVVAVTISPWAIRNVRLLGKFAPMGTQGQMELSAGYSDATWQHKGVWQNLAAQGHYTDVIHDEMTAIEAELAVADKSTADAFDWAKANPAKVVALAPLKVFSELRPRTIVEWIVLALTIIGLLKGAARKQAAVLFGMILINLSAVAITWSVEGRFLVPQIFVFYILSAAGLDALIPRNRTAGGPVQCTESIFNAE